MPERTPLYDAHREAGARMVDFHGWEMPIHYGSQVEEHHAVRRSAGMFDVSHMTVVDVDGDDARSWLRRLLANDVDRLAEAGRALYTPMLGADGGILDDLIVYRRERDWRLVVNSATRGKVLGWLETRRTEDAAAVTLTERDDLAMIAVQGPEALERARGWLGPLVGAVEAAKPFGFVESTADGEERFVARTGYTGEDGFEALLPATAAHGAWTTLAGAGVVPAGLGARDTLRLEAGLNLYGQDMDETVTPLESNIGWTVAFDPADRDFVGRAALERQRSAGVPRRLVGVILEDRGVLRAEQRVFVGDAEVGALTSGAFSPTLGIGIGLARVEAAAFEGLPCPCSVEIRKRRLAARLVRPPFVRRGEAVHAA